VETIKCKEGLGRIHPSSKDMHCIYKLDPHMSGYLIYERHEADQPADWP